MRKRVFDLFLFIALIISFPGKAAGKLPIGFFHRDSVKIGQTFPYTLYYQHPSDQEVIFPDSAFSFAPFEFVSKTFFPTRTHENISTDSAIYMLRTFDLNPVQHLQIPVFIWQKGDTQQVKPGIDSVYLQEMVSVTPQDLASLKSNTALLEVRKRFNYPYVLLSLGFILLLLLVIWVLFSRRIIVNFRLYKLKNDHKAFVSRYNVHIERFNRSQSLQNIEKAITLWKNYLTRLEGSAINSFTTKEITQFYGEDEDVATALRLFDKAIYGNMLSDQSSETIVAFYLLHHFADRRYEYIKDQTRHVSVSR
ncbi:hypothetical protein AHMF7605_04905 [Adhaeribacter arboris]|uniref:Uncharacterized protein n=1 Tax=Adhaeribacter arboris TaxID=2072846 RepID=A0A2T2YBL9_9BACT|nr:hypothetical protein [Adhaeribacter arboris]PSR52912.1 hypothetical protein AHMF7605_04905 [Adhaeribacter arboris]